MASTIGAVYLPDGAVAAGPAGERVSARYAVLCRVTDPRQCRERSYRVAVVLMVWLLAKLAGMQEFSAIAEWMRVHPGTV